MGGAAAVAGAAAVGGGSVAGTKGEGRAKKLAMELVPSASMGRNAARMYASDPSPLLLKICMSNHETQIGQDN